MRGRRGLAFRGQARFPSPARLQDMAGQVYSGLARQGLAPITAWVCNMAGPMGGGGWESEVMQGIIVQVR